MTILIKIKEIQHSKLEDSLKQILKYRIFEFNKIKLLLKELINKNELIIRSSDEIFVKHNFKLYA